jgi:hypothetical protein
LVDFELPGWQIWVEIFGMDLPAYREEEVRRLTALAHAPEYAGWRGAVWDVNKDQPFDDFARELLALLP